MSQRKGFSLIELLVVVAIIGVLIGMLLPAVQRVREAASMAECKSNMHQLGLAAHMFQESNGRIPSIDGNIGNECLFWSLVPFLEDGASQLHPGGMKTFLCPSRRGTTVGAKYDFALPNWGFQFGGPGGNCDFVEGFAGTIVNYFGTPLEVNPPRPLYWYDDSRFVEIVDRFDKIADGASNTLFLAHKGVDPSAYNQTMQWPSWCVPVFGTFDLSDRDLGWDVPSGHINSQMRYPFAFLKEKSGSGYYVDWLSWWNNFGADAPCSEFMTSPHGSMPCLWADGSVRSMGYTKGYEQASYTIQPMSTRCLFELHNLSPDVQVLAKLWLTNDGKSVPDVAN